jgi:hypothetical protein
VQQGKYYTKAGRSIMTDMTNEDLAEAVEQIALRLEEEWGNGKNPQLLEAARRLRAIDEPIDINIIIDKLLNVGLFDWFHGSIVNMGHSRILKEKDIWVRWLTEVVKALGRKVKV